MRYFLQVISLLALVATIGPPLLFWGDKIDQALMTKIMFAATVVWFVVTPLWMDRPGKKTTQD